VLMILVATHAFFEIRKRKDDNWGLKRELGSMIIISILLAAVWQGIVYVLSHDPNALESTAFFLCVFFKWFLYVLCLKVAILNPLYDAHKLSKMVQEEITIGSTMVGTQPNPTAQSKKLTLREYLETTQGYESFYKHMEGELALENLAFYKASIKFRLLVQEFCVSSSDYLQQELLRQADEIFQEFIPPSAPSSVNLSHNARAAVSKAFKELPVLAVSKTQSPPPPSIPSSPRSSKSLPATESHSSAVSSLESNLANPLLSKGMEEDQIPLEPSANLPNSLHIFKPAENEILKIMERDSFFRFKTTQEFKESLKAIEEASFASRALPTITERLSKAESIVVDQLSKW
jgi:hypothetical protein